MSLKAELETWASALKAYDENDYEKALDLFSRIADSSKILTNMGLIYATLGEHELAVEQFIAATGLDQYLAVAYFQCGVSNFLLARYELAYKDFDDSLLYLRGNESINYEQLGLKFKLYSAEVLFNKGLSQIYQGNAQQGIADMEEARREKATEEHNVIDDAIQDRGEGYTVFSIPVGVLYRPSEKKLKNVQTKDYLGKAKLVAASDSTDAYTTFTGVTRLQQGINMSGTFVDNAPASRNDAPSRVPLRADEGTGAGATLARAKTTLNVPADREARIAGALAGGAAGAMAGAAAGGNGPPAAPQGAGVARSASAGATPAGIPAGPVRGLSVRKPPAGNASPDRDLAARIDGLALDDSPAPTPPPPTKGPRVTEFYDDYLNSYGEEEEAPPMPPAPQQGDRVAAWARNNANAEPRRQPSARAPPSSYAPSSYGGGGSMRRKLTRRSTRGPSSRAQSTYEEEEEGYGSGGEYDEMYELVKIRVKLHYADDVRGMALTPETPFDEFVDKVSAKFGKQPGGLMLKFKDEDGGKISLRDDMDYELAIETARESARGKPEGKLEVWCTDA